MGSFSFTCAISGLPIAGGDPVRFMLLTENPYSDDNIRCYIHDLWFPRTWPLRAKYNDYGSVEEVEEGAARQAWMEYFGIDLKPVGVGNNSVHDVATSKDMTFDQMLDALWEGRIRVKRRVDLWASEPETQKMMKEMRERVEASGKSTRPDPLKRVIAKGVPTLNRVTARLTKAGFAVNTGNWGEGLLVDEVDYGHIRVRAGYDKDEDLVKAQGLLSRYATMLRAGSGSYANTGELLVCPKPRTEGYHGQQRDRRKGLKVSQMMVREDVWQALCQLRIENAWWAKTSDKTVALKHYKFGAEQVWEKLTKKSDRLAGTFASYELEGGFTGSFAKDPIPFSWGLGSSFKWVARKYRRGEMAEAEVQPFLDGAAEYAFIGAYLTWVRHQWRPSYGNGPQFGEWGMHKAFLEKLAEVAHTNAEEERKQREADEAAQVAEDEDDEEDPADSSLGD